MKSILGRWMALAGATSTLVGCSSFQGMPTPVIDMSSTLAIVDKNKISDSIDKFYSSDQKDRNNLTQSQFRNKIIAIYMAAIDARYTNFIIALSTQNKGSNLYLGTVALGLSSGASIAGEKVANILSAGSAFSTGSQAKVNQTLYYEKTLPALIAGMEASRNEIKAVIIGNMKRNEKDYPLDVAFADLTRYQNSASLDSAIERVTADAAEKSKQARDDVKAAATASPVN